MINKEINSIVGPWLEPLQASLAAMVGRGQCPHAMLFHGSNGTGRRRLALSLARHLLDLPDGATNHPDLLEVTPAEDKRTISIDQIRDSIDFIQLTSHQRGAKVVYLHPATALTRNAANSLLKTLEEPPAGTTVMLIADSLSRLPATIVSRCHRVRVPPAPRDTALAWLQQVRPDVAWPVMLDLAGGAPYLAIELQDTGMGDKADQFERDLEALVQRKTSPLALVKRWLDPSDEFALRWLYSRVSALVRAAMGISTSGPISNLELAHLQRSGNGLQMDACFEYLRAIGDLRRLQNTGINVELNMERLLMAWYGGFHGLGDE